MFEIVFKNSTRAIICPMDGNRNLEKRVEIMRQIGWEMGVHTHVFTKEIMGEKYTINLKEISHFNTSFDNISIFVNQLKYARHMLDMLDKTCPNMVFEIMSISDALTLGYVKNFQTKESLLKNYK